MNDQFEKLRELKKAINTGEVFSLSRERLEQFVAALSHPQAFSLFGTSEFPAICQTARQALALKISEDANQQAKKESRLALIIACMALLAGTVQAVASLWPLVYPSPTLVRADTPLPIYTPASISVHSVPVAPAPQKPVVPAPALQSPKPAAP